MECEKDLHFEIPSGDDMFLLEAVKRKGNKLTVIGEQDYTAVVRPLIILIKFPIEYKLIKAREPRTSWYVALLLEIAYPFYILLSLLGGLFRQKKW